MANTTVKTMTYSEPLRHFSIGMLFALETDENELCSFFLRPFSKTCLQIETVSQTAGMLHKLKMLSVHVTCLFL